MIFKNTFDNLNKEDLDLLNSYFDGYDYMSSGCTFISNYIWRNSYQISWQIIGKYLCISGLENPDDDECDQHYIMSFPLTNNGTYEIRELQETILSAKEIFRTAGKDFSIGLIPESLVHYLEECFPGRVMIEHNRDDDDYIYLKDDLVSLSGRKLHQKKNHLNYFKRNYAFTYEEATCETIPEILKYIKSKNAYKLEETPPAWKEVLEMETHAIEQLLQFTGKGLLSGIIRINGKIEAVTLGEYAKTTNKKTVIVHVEKADDRIRGLYQAINNEFCKRLPDETVYVNREEDMGMENLKQAKMSYKPYKMAKKYSAIVK